MPEESPEVQTGTIMLAGSSVTSKVCSKCGEEKPTSEFTKRKRSKDGIAYWCKVCTRHHSTKYFETHKEEHAEYAKIYRETHKEEIREGKRKWKKTHKGKAAEKRYYQNNKDKILPRCHEYYLETKEDHHERSINWAKENPERTKQISSKYNKSPHGKIKGKNQQHRRRELMEHGDGITLQQWIKILDIQGHRCNDCGRKFSKRLKATEDHIIPLSKGGLHEFENIQALCQRCNSTKNANLDKEYIHTWITEGISTT